MVGKLTKDYFASSPLNIDKKTPIGMAGYDNPRDNIDNKVVMYKNLSGAQFSESSGVVSIKPSAFPSDSVTSVFTRTGAVAAATNDYTWGQINKATSDIADITTKAHTSLSSIGTNTHAQIDTHIAGTGTAVHGDSFLLNTGDVSTGNQSIDLSQNAVTGFTISNTNAGASARARLTLTCDGGTSIIQQIVSTHASLGNVLYIQNPIPTTGHIALNTAGGEVLRLTAGGNAGIGTTSPSASTKLDVNSTTGAFLPPRMTTTQRDALTAINGMIVYNSTTGALNYYKAGTWTAI